MLILDIQKVYVLGPAVRFLYVKSFVTKRAIL